MKDKDTCLTADVVRQRVAARRLADTRMGSVPLMIGVVLGELAEFPEDQEVQALQAFMNSFGGELISGGMTALRLEAVDPVAVLMMGGDVRPADFNAVPGIIWPEDDGRFNELYGEVEVSVEDIGLGIMLDTFAALRPHWQTLNKPKGRKFDATSQQHQAGTSHRSHR